jgi:hypothetical protein
MAEIFNIRSLLKQVPLPKGSTPQDIQQYMLRVFDVLSGGNIMQSLVEGVPDKSVTNSLLYDATKKNVVWGTMVAGITAMPTVGYFDGSTDADHKATGLFGSLVDISSDHTVDIDDSYYGKFHIGLARANHTTFSLPAPKYDGASIGFSSTRLNDGLEADYTVVTPSGCYIYTTKGRVPVTFGGATYHSIQLSSGGSMNDALILLSKDGNWYALGCPWSCAFIV